MYGIMCRAFAVFGVDKTHLHKALSTKGLPCEFFPWAASIVWVQMKRRIASCSNIYSIAQNQVVGFRFKV